MKIYFLVWLIFSRWDAMSLYSGCDTTSNSFWSHNISYSMVFNCYYNNPHSPKFTNFTNICGAAYCCNTAGIMTLFAFHGHSIKPCQFISKCPVRPHFLSYLIFVGWQAFHNVSFLIALVSVYNFMWPLVYHGLTCRQVCLSLFQGHLYLALAFNFFIFFLCGFVLTKSWPCRDQDLASIVCVFCIGEFLAVCTGTAVMLFLHPFGILELQWCLVGYKAYSCGEAVVVDFFQPM